jgi:hypothetical protein
MPSQSPVTVQAISSFVEELEADKDGIGHFFVSTKMKISTQIYEKEHVKDLTTRIALFLFHLYF